jgi:hypothetical protein
MIKWRKSTHSGDPSIGTCVELAELAPDRRGIRDSTDPHGPVISVAPAGLADLVSQIKRGNLTFP